MKRAIILGSTGSIGVQALQVIAGGTDVTVVGMSCDRQVPLLLEQAMSLGVVNVAVADESAAATVNASLFPELTVFSGPRAAARLVREVEADIVLNAIVGFAGLEATLEAVKARRTLALANKESLVCAGGLVYDVAGRHEAAVIPVDSEHSALFQLVAAAGQDSLSSVIITASGGPFLGRSREQLESVTKDQALEHPTWLMGPKITIDSATLVNKGLEVIEAHHLFSLPYDKIEVLIHPQSIVHGMARMVDGAVLAHLGVADMRVPIGYALHYPSRKSVSAQALDLARIGRLEFAPPDELTFPAIRLARQAGTLGDRSACAYNAANEVAVQAFLDGEFTFLGISSVIESVLERGEAGDFSTYEEVEQVDQWARATARKLIGK